MVLLTPTRNTESEIKRIISTTLYIEQELMGSLYASLHTAFTSRVNKENKKTFIKHINPIPHSKSTKTVCFFRPDHTLSRQHTR